MYSLQTLLRSLKCACEILADDECKDMKIPFDTFVQLYTYLADLDGDISQDCIDSFLSELRAQA